MTDSVEKTFNQKKVVSVEELYWEVAGMLHKDANDDTFRKDVRGRIDMLHKKNKIRQVKRGVWELI